MAIEFVNHIGMQPPGTKIAGPPLQAPIDVEWLRRYVRTIDEWGFDYTLVPHTSAGFDQFSVAATVLAATTNLKTVVAVRPNTHVPTVAAQALATLDQLSGGRALVHVISGGSDAEQQRQGDYLDKEQRYRRTAEFVQVLRQVWETKEPFSHHGEFFDFDDFGPGYETSTGRSLPVSIGGSSSFAHTVGGAHGDIVAFYGEPLAQTAEQIANVYDGARKAGRTDRIRFWATFRPVVADTEELAQEKARRIVEAGSVFYARAQGAKSTNAGSVRLREIAELAETHDGGVLWTPKAFAGAGGASSLMVGTPETIAAALVKYVEIGVDIFSLPALGELGDAIETGRKIIPLVKEEVARRGIDPEITFRAAQPVG